jgi:hypothetical protein
MKKLALFIGICSLSLAAPKGTNAQEAAWIKHTDVAPEYSAMYSLGANEDCTIWVGHDGTYIMIITFDPHYVHKDGSRQLEWRAVQDIVIKNFPRRKRQIDWGKSMTPGLVDAWMQEERSDIFAKKYRKYAKFLPEEIQDRFAGYYGIGKPTRTN